MSFLPRSQGVFFQRIQKPNTVFLFYNYQKCKLYQYFSDIFIIYNMSIFLHAFIIVTNFQNEQNVLKTIYTELVSIDLQNLKKRFQNKY